MNTETYNYFLEFYYLNTKSKKISLDIDIAFLHVFIPIYSLKFR